MRVVQYSCVNFQAVAFHLTWLLNWTMAHDPRQVLEKFYSLKGQLPAEIVVKVNPKQPDHHGSIQRGVSPADMESFAVAELFSDDRLTLEQREQLSLSILNGNYEIKQSVTAPSPQRRMGTAPFIMPKNHEKQRVADLTVYRHSLPKPNFLEVVTESVPIPKLSGNDLRKLKTAQCKRQRAGKSFNFR
jgi:hypothetical protein